MAKSEATNSGCFSGILRRMLCSGSVPTHPSDHITDLDPTQLSPNPEKEPLKKHEIQAQPGPGVVARLMGLDSLPADTNCPSGRSRDSFSRSRSVNFADYMLKYDMTEPHQHRRVRTSVSFREVPVSFKPQNQDFVVVYLDNVDEYSKETIKSEKGFVKGKQGKKKEKVKIDIQSSRMKNKKEKVKIDIQSSRMKNKKENEATSNKISKLKNEPRRRIMPKTPKTCKQNGAKVLGSVLQCKANFQRVNLKTLKPENRKKVPENLTKKRKHHHASKKIRPAENNPENLIPVSDLDEVYDLLVQHGTLFSDNDNVRPINSVERKDNGKIEQRDLAADYIELAEQLRRLTEEDLSESYWSISNSSTSSKIKKLHFECFEEICVDFEQPILDLLLHEVLSELAEIS
ncbi:ALC-interacting protein [Parasponia andersonii]|uniref:ALC-interacting protein n=1 Tax=Parasponia andersonii TaxID=3476 RepID=A0A2P5AF20_PARAD|nr:ALC-interacting protein [Parasponia andersonii]